MDEVYMKDIDMF